MLCCRLLTLLVSWLPFVSSQARSYSAYFRLLLRLAESRQDIARFLFQHGAVAAIVRLYCSTQPTLHFNCRPQQQQQQHTGPAQQQQQHASAASPASSPPVRLFHPHRGHLAVSLLAVLVGSCQRAQGRQQQQQRRPLREALEPGDRRLLLAGLLSEPGAAEPGGGSSSSSSNGNAQAAQAAVTRSSGKEEEEQKKEERGGQQPQQPEAPQQQSQPQSSDADGEQSVSAEAVRQPGAGAAAAGAGGREEEAAAAPAVSDEAPPAPSPSPSAAAAPSCFPFFPFVLADSSCLTAVCSLTASLCRDDERLSVALLDCCMEHLLELLGNSQHRTWGGAVVHNQPMHSADPPPQQSPQQQQQPAGAAAAPWPQPGVCRVSDFLTVLGCWATLLSLSDSLTAARVDAGLSRLFAVVRRVTVRRHAAAAAGGGLGSGSGINGTEERFLLVAARCLLRLAVNQRAVAVWLRAHEREWAQWEQLLQWR